MEKKKLLSLAAVMALIGSVSLYGGSEGDGADNVYYGDGTGSNLGGGGDNNVFMGLNAGHITTGGSGNTFSGYQSGYSNTTGSFNTFSGDSSGYSNTIASTNTFIGAWSGMYNTTGSDNTFSGFSSGRFNTESLANTFTGSRSGVWNTVGSFNTFSGCQSGQGNTSGNRNTFSGYSSGFYNSTGDDNTFSGMWSGQDNTTGSRNTFSGAYSGRSNTTGSDNTFAGYYSGHNADINGSVLLGQKAGYYATRDNTLYIANSDTITPLIYGEFDTRLVRVNGALEAVFEGAGEESVYRLLTLSSNDTDGDGPSEAGFVLTNALYQKEWLFRTIDDGTAFTATLGGTGGAEFKVSSPTGSYLGTELFLGNGASNKGGVWINASSRALKENIKPLSTKEALTAFSKLQPVTYNYKTDKSEKVVGFIAEDVPALVAINSRDGLSSMDMVAVLTKVVQEQEQVLAEVRTELMTTQAKIAKQDTKITKLETMQKKVAQLESILTNLALDTSKTQKEKVSLSLK